MIYKKSSLAFSIILTCIITACLIPLFALGSISIAIYSFSLLMFLVLLKAKFYKKELLGYLIIQLLFFINIALSGSYALFNSLFICFQIIFLLAFLNVSKINLLKLNDVVDNYAIYTIAAIILINIFIFSYSTDASISRLKFSGSTSYLTTLSSLMAIYVISPTGYLKNSFLSSPRRITLYFIAFLPIMLTVVRGNFLVTVFGSLLVNKDRLGLNFRTIIYFFLICIFSASLYLLGIFDLFIQRSTINEQLADPSNINTLSNLSSGRLTTWILIINEFFKGSIQDQVFGFGLGSMEAVASMGFEYPHFDLLWILFELGIVGVLIFITCIYKLARKYTTTVIMVVFINGLHTNFILFIGLLVFVPLIAGKMLKINEHNI